MQTYPETFKLTDGECVIRLRDGAFIAKDSAVYQSWLAEGNQPEPAERPPAPSYKDLRATEYPDFSDYLDGVVKGDQAQIESYIQRCLAVKAKYPKPTPQ